MAVDFLKTADFLQEELQTFYRTLRCGEEGRELQTAIERLRAAVNQVEPLVNDLGEQWRTLTVEQRWGYLRVVSHMGTASHELKLVSGSAG